MCCINFLHCNQCKATHTLLNKLGHLAADSGRVTKGAWIEGALCRLGVALCNGNDFVFRTNMLAPSSVCTCWLG